tara:strand:- start:175 stop:420 length:246 start_codon:yes stop_codon:yes gene_type:complete
MKIKYFAWIKDITLCDEEKIDDSKINDIENLKLFLINKYPNLKKHIQQKILRFAINKEYISNNSNLKNDDEIAVFPPVSGG